MPRLDWHAVVSADDFSDVMRLVHLAARYDPVDVDEIRVQLLRHRRQAYEDELSIQAAHVGCPGRQGVLGEGPALSELNALCVDDAESIANTYNYYMANAIRAIRDETPTANRHIYATRLQTWGDGYWDWKQGQIDQYTDGTARALALQDFYRNNGQFGTAILLPETAVCPVCQGWLDRGEVPLRVATNNPPPYHVNCPHYWLTDPDKIAREDCPLLWMGE